MFQVKHLPLLAMGIAGLLACTSTDFSSASSSAKKNEKSTQKSPDKDGDKDKGTGKGDQGDTDKGKKRGAGGSDAGGDDAGGGTDAGTGDGDLGSTADSGSGGDGVNDADASVNGLEIDECLSAKADNYNVLLVFDNSGSQNKTDPTYVRRDGALSFIDKFYDYAKKNPKAAVNIGTLAFNNASMRPGNGWLRLRTDDLMNQIKGEIQTATSNPDGATAYSPVLRDGVEFFKTIDTAVEGRSRNYVVFLTDGQPNAAEFPAGSPMLVETMTDISDVVTDLTSNYGVAFIAVASGSGLSVEGEQIVQSYLAKPDIGVVAKDHIGMYRRAHDAAELKQVMDSLIADIGSCD